MIHSVVTRPNFIRSGQGPVFLVSGEHDINPEQSRRLALGLPDATSTRVDGVGHYVPLEAPDVLTVITAQAIAAA